MTKGRLFLIPSPLGEYDPAEVIPQPVLERIKGIRKYVVEEARTVRRYLSAAGLKGHIGELELRELNEHSSAKDVETLLDMFSDPDGTPTDVGLISEAGLPAVADPGAQLVALPYSWNQSYSDGRAVLTDDGPDGIGTQRAEFRFLRLPAGQDR